MRKDIASIELCETLLQKTGWVDTRLEWAYPSSRASMRKKSFHKVDEPYIKGMRSNPFVTSKQYYEPHFIAPAYDLLYTVDKLKDRLTPEEAHSILTAEYPANTAMLLLLKKGV